MKILVANDDGIRAEGIYKLVQGLAEIGEVYVAAPREQKSASSHSISINNGVSVSEVHFDNARIAFEVDGTPADCVKLGLYILEKKNIRPDIVVSGINHGGNLGTDTLYSGTVGAAMEGSFMGCRSLAVSINDHFPDSFDYAVDLAKKACLVAAEQMEKETVLNINVPNLPVDEIKGVKITRLGKREYEEWFTEKVNERGTKQFFYSGKPVKYEGLPGDIDVMAMQEGYASITPLQFNLTDYKILDEIKNWGFER